MAETLNDTTKNDEHDAELEGIAIVGMAGQFPGAHSLDEFWKNLESGRETISEFSREELVEAGVPESELNDRNYVPRAGVIDHFDVFDAAFFGLTGLEARVTVPQHRLFLQAAWSAMEDAGYVPGKTGVSTGVFVGCSEDAYYELNLLPRPDIRETAGTVAVTIGNGKDYLASRVAHKLGLKGPAVTVQTACSTSLVAVHMACQSVLAGECDMALAGGTSIRLLSKRGYLHEPGNILSSDGHCRAFDAKADGTVPGDGLGVVLLKSLAKAVADGDHIHAVILGSAINNDGADKTGYTAPSVKGQSAVIGEALAVANVPPESIGYVEAHGTGTVLGDPIEMTALRAVFGASASGPYCGIGSVKTNIGHLDAAAGIAGLIKVVLALKHRTLPPSLHFEKANPELPIVGSAFRVIAAAEPWLSTDVPRRAGVSSFGIGGTNVHAILQEAHACPAPPAQSVDAPHILILSARTQESLDRGRHALIQHLETVSPAELADVAYTTRVGRTEFRHRQAFVANDLDAMLGLLKAEDKGARGPSTRRQPLVFMFPPQGSQRPGAVKDLYARYGEFRKHVDICARIVHDALGVDFREVILGSGQEAAAPVLDRVLRIPLEVFIVEYALARLLQSFGLKPDALIGHSLAEYVAATLAQVMTIEDALRLVIARARIADKAPAGAMLAVLASAADVKPYLVPGVEIAAINSAVQCTVSGETDKIVALQARLDAAEITCQRVDVATAGHSELLTPVLGEFGKFVSGISLSPPKIPIVSTVTGGWMTDEQATSASYWVDHFRRCVLFQNGLETISRLGTPCLLEVGPGAALTGFVRQSGLGLHNVIPLIGNSAVSGAFNVRFAAAELWTRGFDLDWSEAAPAAGARRRSIPGYQFARDRHWIDAPSQPRPISRAHRETSDISRDSRYSAPSWKRQPRLRVSHGAAADQDSMDCVLVLADPPGGAQALLDRLEARGSQIILVTPGSGFKRVSETSYQIDSRDPENYRALLAAIEDLPRPLSRIIHAWGLSRPEAGSSSQLGQNFLSLNHLIGAASSILARRALQVDVLTTGVFSVDGEEVLDPAASLACGPCRVAPSEYPHLAIRHIDLGKRAGSEVLLNSDALDLLIGLLLAPIQLSSDVVATRGRHAWVPIFEPVFPDGARPHLRDHGHYVITGGLGGLAAAFAEYLTSRVTAPRLTLIGRSMLLPQSQWPELVESLQTDEDLRSALRHLLELKARGAIIRYASADVSDEQSLSGAIDEAAKVSGAVAGVFHAAGVDAGGLLRHETADGLTRLLAAKVAGTLSLARCVERFQPDFMLLCSSQNAFWPAIGQTGYCAANCFLDAYAQVQSSKGGHVISINWGGWDGRGMAARAITKRGEGQIPLIDPADAPALFDAALTFAGPQLLISAEAGETAERAGRSTAAGAAESKPAVPLARDGSATALESQILSIWRTLFGIEKVGLDDNFFELGGHSLLALRMISEFRKAYAIEVSLSDFLRRPTPAEIAQWIFAMVGGHEKAIPRCDRAARLPLSHQQQRLWFLDQLDPTVGPAYNVVSSLRLKGSLEPKFLRQSLERIWQRHEVLRTRIVERDGVPSQLIEPAETGLLFEEINLDALPRDQAVAQAAFLARQCAAARFDLGRGPLFRGMLVRLNVEEHVLVLVQHHIVSDGWSVGILLREMMQSYAALLGGKAEALPDLPLQYADYAAWQRGQLDREDLARQLASWQEHLQGAPGLIELPADRARPPVQTYRGGRIAVRFGGALTQALRSLSQRHGVTLYMTLLSAWSVLLTRLSGQSEVVVGTPTANRGVAELEPLIGFFANTLALRMRPSPEQPVAALLRQTKEVLLAGYERQEVPFERVVEALQLERSLAYPPVFQTVFAFDNLPQTELSMPGLELLPFDFNHSPTKFDLTLELSEQPEGVTGQIEYASDLFEHSTVERWAGHLIALLEAMVVADDAAPVWRLPLLTEAERAGQLESWNATAAPVPAVRCVHALFEEQVERSPDAVALVSGTQRLSYGELNARANRLAHHLIERGVGPDSLVAICAERSPQMIVALLAVLKAGGAYVPLDPNSPLERLADILEDSAPSVCLIFGAAGTRLRSALDGRAMPVLDLEADAAAWEHLSPANPEVAALRPEHLAYVIYTSGSTGRPKGVLIEHRNVARLFGSTESWFRFGPTDVWSLFHSVSFDFSVWEIWGALLYGGRLVVISALTGYSPTDFHALLCEEGITVLNQTPSAFRGLIAAQRESASRHDLRLVIFGGEALDPAMLRPWYRDTRNAPVEMVNMYGITETTVHVTRHVLSSSDANRVGSSPIGYPIPDLRIYILDERREPVPMGVAGEIYVGGAGVARGYLNRPELTAERFIPNPFVAGDRLYRTGDLARCRPDGSIDYLGRNDDQVKIRGFRVELGEIEAALLGVPGVGEAIVLARPDARGERRLVAYWLASGAEALPVTAMRSALSQRLPDYMVPAAFVRIEKWPLTPNGKLDRGALPEPGDDAVAHVGYEAPLGDVEEAIAAIWRDVLSLDRVGRRDKFFEIGGDSLRSIAVVAKSRQAGILFSVADLFRHPTIAALAASLKQPGASLPLDEFVPTEATVHLDVPDGVEEVYDATMLQRGMFFLNSMKGHENAYLDVQTMRLQVTRWDEAALRLALNTVSQRHQTLRTAFEFCGTDRHKQLVHRSAEIPLTVVDLTAHGEEIQQTTIATFLLEQRRRPFDISQVSLLRAYVHQRGGQDIQFTLSFHHAILDGLSLTLLLNELFELYANFSAGNHAGLPYFAPLPSPRLGVQVEKQGLASPANKAFWTSYCEPCVPTVLPKLDRLGAPTDDLEYAVPDALARRLNEIAGTLGVPLRTVVLCAHMRVLSALSGVLAPVSGLVSNMRPEVEGGDRMLGLFLNTLPFRLDLRPGSWEELILRTYDEERNVIPHRNYPYLQIVSDSGNNIHLDAIFNYVDFQSHDRNQSLKKLQVRESRLEGETGFGLAISVSGSVDAVVLVFEVDKARFDGDFLRALASYYLATLAAMASDIGAPWTQARLPGIQERYALIHGFNATQTSYPRDRLMHQGFEGHAQSSPNAVAAICGDETWTYAELNRQANRIAHRLRQQGVGRGDRVAICLTRGLPSIAALIGVLKAGAAYVPLDPRYPDERLRIMLEDCSPRAVLTELSLRDNPALAGSGVPVFAVDDEAAWQGQSEIDLDHRAIGQTPDDVAYIIYTSGSTGKPKGVVVQHRPAVNLFEWARSEFEFASTDRVLFTTSFCFDLSVFDVFGILWCGGSIHIATEDDLDEPDRLVALLRDRRITFWDSAPAAFGRLLPILGEEPLSGHLRLAFFSGDWIPLDLPEALRRVFPNCEVIALGGATEATVWSNYHRIARIAPEWVSIPYGRPIPNARYYILDANCEPCLIGVEGDLYIGGECLVLGYFNNEQLSSERFIADPFVDGGKMYRTGDRARFWRDGTIEFLGRLDDQVKIRGYRIELAEVRAAMLRCAGVRDAVALVRHGGDRQKRLIGYYVPDNEIAVSSDALRAALRNILPEYMVPSAFLALDSWPLTQNGKLDYAALPQSGSEAGGGECEPPADEFEKALADIWRELLSLKLVGRNDHFLEAGGHSLLTVQLAVRVREEFQVKLAISDFVNAPILSSMASLIRDEQRRMQSVDEEEILRELEGKTEDELKEMLKEFEET